MGKYRVTPFENARCEEAATTLISRGGLRACNEDPRAEHTPGYATQRGHARMHTHTHRRATRAGIQLGYRISPARILGTRPPSHGTSRPMDHRKSSGDRTSGPRDARVSRTPHARVRRVASGTTRSRTTTRENRGTSVTRDDATSVRARRGAGEGRVRKTAGGRERGGRSANTCGSNCPNLTSTGV